MICGKATKVSTRRSVAAMPHDHQQRLKAKDSLRYPPVTFNGRQALSIGIGFKRAIEESGYVLHACSILPQHVHMVILRHAAHCGADHRTSQRTSDPATCGRWPSSAGWASRAGRGNSVALGTWELAGVSARRRGDSPCHRLCRSQSGQGGKEPAVLVVHHPVLTRVAAGLCGSA